MLQEKTLKIVRKEFHLYDQTFTFKRQIKTLSIFKRPGLGLLGKK